MSLRVERSNLCLICIMLEKRYHLYLMTNKTKTVIYTGISSDIQKRVHQHKLKVLPGFTSEYNVDRLVYFEEYSDPQEAIIREKQIKAGSRKKKIELIERNNLEWRDLSDNW